MDKEYIRLEMRKILIELDKGELERQNILESIRNIAEKLQIDISDYSS